jgi:hypothetical protein
MSITATQRNETNNQSTVDYVRKNLFLYGARFYKGVLANNTDPEASQAATIGQLVVRDTGNAGQLELATADNLADVIGITFMNPATLADNAATVKIDYAIKGDIDGGLLSLPTNVALDTTVGNKALRDILTDLGFVIFTVQEQTKIDN